MCSSIGKLSGGMECVPFIRYLRVDKKSKTRFVTEVVGTVHGLLF